MFSTTRRIWNVWNNNVYKNITLCGIRAVRLKSPCKYTDNDNNDIVNVPGAARTTISLRRSRVSRQAFDRSKLISEQNDLGSHTRTVEKSWCITRSERSAYVRRARQRPKIVYSEQGYWLYAKSNGFYIHIWLQFTILPVILPGRLVWISIFIDYV